MLDSLGDGLRGLGVSDEDLRVQRVDAGVEKSKPCQVSQPHNTNRGIPSAIPIGSGLTPVHSPDDQTMRYPTNVCAR